MEGILDIDAKNSLRTGFEPVRENPNRFQVCRLNHSAIAAVSLLNFITIFIRELVFKLSF